MRLWFNLKNTPNGSTLLTEKVILGMSILLVCPFFILSYFTNPSADDYAFVFNTDTLGFWKAQWTSYFTWTGRYSSMFLLSAHPLQTGSLILYKLVPVLLLSLTIHSLYRFISFTFNFSGKTINLLLAIVFTFCFLNGMPTLAEGIYWLPGSVTYHLANILVLYLTVNILNTVCNSKLNTSPGKKFINYLLIFTICGMNETSMVELDMLLVCFLITDVFPKKRIKTELILYISLAVICSLIVVLSSGNAVRGSDIVDPNKHQLSFTIISGFKAGINYMSEWLSSFSLVIVSVITFLFYMSTSVEETFSKKKGVGLLLLLSGGYLLISFTFLPGFWSLSSVPPQRTINVTYWLFICFWISTLAFLLNFIHPFLKRFQSKKYIYLIPPLVTLLLFPGPVGNYGLALGDIVSGKASVFNTEFSARDKALKQCEGPICNVSIFSVFPKSIFTDDFGPNESNWWNQVYAHYYKKSGIRVFYKEPTYVTKYFFNFENDATQLLENRNTISSEAAFSLPNSSAVLPSSYSATFTKKVKHLKVKNVSEISKIHISTLFYSPDSIVDAVIVVCIYDSSPSRKNIFWDGKAIGNSSYKINKWIKEEFLSSIGSEFLSPENEISIYVWNRGRSKILIDDLEITAF